MPSPVSSPDGEGLEARRRPESAVSRRAEPCSTGNRASLDRSLDSLRVAFGRTVAPVQLPVGEEKDFRGSVDLLAMQAVTFPADGSGRPTTGEVPEGMRERAEAARESLIELVAEANDALMEKFFEEGTLTQAELEAGLRASHAHPHVFPLLCTSAHANLGIPPLLDAVAAYLPSPEDRPFPAVDRESGEPATLRLRGGRAGRGLRLEDDRRPVRRADYALPGRGGDAQDRLVAAQTSRKTRRSASEGWPSCRENRQCGRTSCGRATSAPCPS